MPKDTIMCRLGWVLVVVSTALILTSTLAAPPTADDQVPSAPRAPDSGDAHRVRCRLTPRINDDEHDR